MAPIEKGRAAHQIFLANGIDMDPKKLAGKVHLLHNIESGHNKWPTGNQGQLEKISEICDDMGKSKRTIRTWLESISISKTVQKAEVGKPSEERTSGTILARLSTIDSKTKQKKAYSKIKRDGMNERATSHLIYS